MHNKLIVAVLLLTACGQVQFESVDSSVETGDAGTQPIYEGGVLAQYRCLRDPMGKQDMGVDSGAPIQIWLDGNQLFNCYAEKNPPCRAMGTGPTVFECSTKQLETYP